MENFPNLRREKVTQIQETQGVRSKRNPKRPTSRYIIIKMTKFQDKEGILKAAREKQEVTHKGTPIRLAADFSMKCSKPEGMARNIPSNENQRPATKNTLSSMLSINMEGQMSFPDKRSLKEYASSKPALQEMLKGLL